MATASREQTQITTSRYLIEYASGLSSDEAAKRLQHYGPNRLPEPPLPGVIRIFMRQFLSPFIYILLIAGIISYLLDQLPNAILLWRYCC